MRVTVYTKPMCPPCNGTKRAFTKLGIPFVELPAPDHLDRIAALGYREAPVVEVDYGEGVTTSWSGFSPSKIEQLHQTL